MFGYGQQNIQDTTHDFNVLAFIIERMLARVVTMKIVKVVAVHPSATEGAAGTVDVMPLVNQVDGNGNMTEHGTVYSLLYFRLQGGQNAVVLEPAVNDVGLCVVSDRDISAARTNPGKQVTPGSQRKFDLADGIYVGGILNAAPTQKVAFTDTGIVLSDKNGNKIEFKVGSIDVTTTAFRCNGAVIAGFGGADQVNVQTHSHLTAGTGPPSPPTPGT